MNVLERRRDDAGSMTIWVLTGLGVVAAAVMLATALGVAVTARHRAAAGADQAALAGAGAVLRGPDAACATAATAGAVAGVRVTGCRVEGAVVTVTASAGLADWLRWAGSAEAVARAGPVGADADVPGPIDYAS